MQFVSLLRTLISLKLFLISGLLLFLSGGSIFAADVSILRLSSGMASPLLRETNDGMMDLVMNEVFSRTPMEYQKMDVLPERGLQLANEGVTDGELGRLGLVADLYPNLIKVPEPIFRLKVAGVYTDPNISITSLEEFGNYRVGYVRGRKNAEKLFAGFPEFEVVKTPENLLRMLALGRIDVAFFEVTTAFDLAKVNEIETLYMSDYRIERDLFLFLNVKHTALVGVLDMAIKEMKADGTYDSIMASFHPTNR